MQEKREKVIKELKKDTNGFTISELSRKLNFSRQTITNCLMFLEGAQTVKIRQVGMAKIYFWEGKK